VATRASAREKFVNSVTSDLAVDKMAGKLSTYLGISVSPSSGPIRNWTDVVGRHAGELFDKCYENMQAAYRG
jgi:hypothetical protein